MLVFPCFVIGLMPVEQKAFGILVFWLVARFFIMGGCLFLKKGGLAEAKGRKAMRATSESQDAQRAERERKRAARAAQTEEERAAELGRKKAARAAQTEAGREAERERKRAGRASQSESKKEKERARISAHRAKQADEGRNASASAVSFAANHRKQRAKRSRQKPLHPRNRYQHKPRRLRNSFSRATACRSHL